jgi:hypothetical protein
MNITLDYTLTYDEFAEAHRAHRTPIRTQKPRSWRTLLGGIATALGLLIFLALTTLRPIPNTPPGRHEFFIDPTIPIVLIPHACVAAFLWLVFRRSPALRKSACLIYLALALGAALVAYSNYLDRQLPPPPPPPPSPNSNSLQLFLPLLSWILVFAAVWVALYRILRNFGRAEWDGNPSLQHPVKLTITPTTLVFRQQDRQTEYRWPAFVKYRQSPNLFLLYVSESGFEIIPRRAFADLLELHAFEELLRSTLPTPDPTSIIPPRILPPPPLPIHLQPLESRDFI